MTSKKQENVLTRALERVCNSLEEEFEGIQLQHVTQWFLRDAAKEAATMRGMVFSMLVRMCLVKELKKGL